MEFAYDTLADVSHRVPVFAGGADLRIDQIVEILASRIQWLVWPSDDHSFAVVSFDPKTLNETFVRVADRVGVDPASERHLPNAWQLISGFQLRSRDQESNLL